jgi:hypothetical protein
VRKLSNNVSDIEPRNRITTRLCTLSKTKLQVGKKEISGTANRSKRQYRHSLRLDRANTKTEAVSAEKSAAKNRLQNAAPKLWNRKLLDRGEEGGANKKRCLLH